MESCMKVSFDKYLLGSLCLFAIASFLSIAGANVFLGLSTLFFLIVLFRNKDADITCSDDEYFKVIAVFAGVLLVSALCSANIGYGLKTWADFFLWRFMPFIIISLLFANEESVSKLLKAIGCGYFISCLYAVYQGVFVFKMNIAHGRADGFVGHPMTLAGWSCILLPALLVFVFRKDISKKLHLACIALFIVGCIAIVFNSTRGAWLALAIALPLISLPFILKSKKLFMGFASVVVILGLVLANNASFMKRFDSIADTKHNWSNASRFIIWDTAYGIFKEHPVLGVGLGSFSKEYKSKFVDSKELKQQAAEYYRYRKNLKQKKLTAAQKKFSKAHIQKLAVASRKVWENKTLRDLSHAHNNFIQMLAENGLVGFAGYIFAFGFILWKNIKNYFLNKNPYALMIVGSTGALMLQGFTEYNFGNSSVMKIYWFVLACLVILAGCYNKENAEEKS